MSSWTTEWRVSFSHYGSTSKCNRSDIFTYYLQLFTYRHSPNSDHSTDKDQSSRTLLLGLCHTGQISNARQGILDKIARHSLLRYRGGRGGRRQCRYRQLHLTTNPLCGNCINQASVRILIIDVHSRPWPGTSMNVTWPYTCKQINGNNHAR